MVSSFEEEGQLLGGLPAGVLTALSSFDVVIVPISKLVAHQESRDVSLSF